MLVFVLGGIVLQLDLIKLHKEVVDRLGQMVDLLLQLLDVLVHGVRVRRVGRVRVAKLLVVAKLGLLDLVVHLSNDLLHLLSLAHLAEHVSLELEHGLSNDLVVEVDHVGGDLLPKLRILVHDWLELLLSEPIGVDMVERLVAELSPSAEHVLITANDGLVAQLDVEVLVLAVGEADAVLAVLLLGDVGAP